MFSSPWLYIQIIIIFLCSSVCVCPLSLSRFLSHPNVCVCVRECARVRACVRVCVCADGCAGAERPDGGRGAVHVHLSLSPGKNPPLQLQAVVAGFWGLLAWWYVADWRGGVSLVGAVVCRLLAWCVTGSIGVVVCHWFYWRGGVSLVGVVVCRWLAWWCVAGWRSGVSLVLLAWWCVGGWRGGVSVVGVVVCRWLAWWCVAGWRGGVLLVGVVTCCWLAW